MRRFIVLTALLLMSALRAFGQGGPASSGDGGYDLSPLKMAIRDPFIVTDHDNGCYWLMCPKTVNGVFGLSVYKSLNLERWKWVPSGDVFNIPEGWLGKKDFWAPDFYFYRGAWWCFFTIAPQSGVRGVTVWKGGSHPTDPYSPVLPPDRLCYTPENQYCIDGSLYVDDRGTPYMLWSHEFIDTEDSDGVMYAARMKKDLSGISGRTFRLFSASEAKGVVPAGTNRMNGRKQYVTDAPFVWKDDESGNLIMIWSSMTAGGYGILQAISPSGKIDGPWELDNPPVFTNKGGHAHIFRDLNGKLRIVFFRKKQGKTQVCIKPLFIENGKIIPL